MLFVLGYLPPTRNIWARHTSILPHSSHNRYLSTVYNYSSRSTIVGGLPYSPQEHLHNWISQGRWTHNHIIQVVPFSYYFLLCIRIAIKSQQNIGGYFWCQILSCGQVWISLSDIRMMYLYSQEQVSPDFTWISN